MRACARAAVGEGGARKRAYTWCFKSGHPECLFTEAGGEGGGHKQEERRSVECVPYCSDVFICNPRPAELLKMKCFEYL